MTSLKVGAVQAEDIQGDIPATLGIIHMAMQRADEAGIAILCFPECFLQGYTLDGVTTAQRAINFGSRRFYEITKQLSEYNVAAIIGVIEEDGGDYFNTAVVVRHGSVLGKYRKVHLFEKNFTAGKENPVFNVDGTLFGVNICYDARFEDGAAELARDGARVIFYPLNNRLPTDRATHYRDRHLPNLIERANQTGCLVVSSDVVMQSEVDVAYGCTAVVHPFDGKVGRVRELEIGMVVTELP